MVKKDGILAIIFVIIFMLPTLADHADKPGETKLSSIESFLIRKNYPYDQRADPTLFQVKPQMDKIHSQDSLIVDTLVTFSNGPMNSSWPMKSYNAQHTSRTNVNTSDNIGIEKWIYDIFSAMGVDSGAAVAADGTVYFGSNDFYALSPNGSLRWQYETGIIYAVPALAEDGTIYITSTDNKLYALNPTGSLKWLFNTGEITSASPVIAPNGTIYIGHSQGRVFAINPNGTEQWHYDLTNDIYGSAALGLDGSIYIGCWDGRLYALNPNGTLKWYYPTDNHVKGVPSIAPDGTVYFGSWDGYLYALHPNGTLRWRCQVGHGTETTPALAEDGTIYVGGDDLYAVTPSGVLKWTFELGSSRYIFTSCPAVSVDGTIYVGVDIGQTSGGEMLAVNADGTERWRKFISDDWVDSSPAIGPDGTVYIGSTGVYTGNGLHAFGVIESNVPPNPPTIEGPTSGKPNTEYNYFFPTIDPDNNPVTVFIDWGDGTSQWTYEGASNENIWASHSWSEKGTYAVMAKARDVLGLESNWSTMEVTMPFSIEPPHFRFIEWLLERFPNAFPILRYLLGC